MKPTRGTWRLAAAIAAFAVLSVPTIAGAEERPVTFSLRLEEGPLDRCGGEGALTQSVDERLHRSAFAAEDEADITFAITRGGTNDATWNAQIVESDRTGTELGRRDVPLPVDDCAKALETLAVVLAIMIGPQRTTTEPPHVPPSPLPEASAPTRVPTPPRRPPAPPRAAPPARWRAAPLLGVVVGSGILPRLAWGLEAGVVVEPPLEHLSAVVRGAFWPALSTGTEPPADIDRIGGSLLACYELFRSRGARDGLGLAGCGGGDLSRIGARSADLTRPSDASLLVGLLGELRLGYRLPLRDSLILEPVLAAQISGLLRRDRFTYRDASGRELTLLEPAFGAVQAGFGVAVHFL